PGLRPAGLLSRETAEKAQPSRWWAALGRCAWQAGAWPRDRARSGCSRTTWLSNWPVDACAQPARQDLRTHLPRALLRDRHDRRGAPQPYPILADPFP